MNRLAPLTLLALGACFNDKIEQAYDQDGDGFDNVELGGPDCDDDNALINPDAPEVCGDGVDNDCDGNIDDAGFGNVTWYPDVDGDGYGDITAQQTCVAPEDSVPSLAGGADCNDTDSAVHPGAEDECDDNVDNDCNGVVDDSPDSVTFYLDNDLDGYAGAEEFRACEAPQVSVPDLSAGVDCDDTNDQVSPREVEVCGDGLDNNCDGATDDSGDNNVLWYPDADGDGYPSTVAVQGCTAPAGSFSSLPSLTDCNDADASISPDAAEVYYDGVDQNCDGANDYDADGDGIISDAHGGSDCLDTNAAVNPGGQEICGDGLDNNCDGATDDSGIGATTWYIDSDTDGFPGPTPFSGCSAPSGSFSSPSGGVDCNDLDGSVRPNATEVYYDGVDQNCDGANDYDADGDGVSSDSHGGQDCDDSNNAVRPGVAEVCNNGLDDDCSGDAPECAWPVGGSLEDVAHRQGRNVQGGAVAPLLFSGDLNGDGNPDLAALLGTRRMDVVFGPITVGDTAFPNAVDVQLLGTGDTLSMAAMDVAYASLSGSNRLVVSTLSSGPVYSFPVPIPQSGSLDDHRVPVALSPTESRFGRSVVEGMGFDGGPHGGISLLQGARGGGVTSGWAEGLHIWPSGRPLLITQYNIAPIFRPAGSYVNWQYTVATDVDGDGLDDIVAWGDTSSEAGVVAVEYSPQVDDATMGTGARVTTSSFWTAMNNGSAKLHAQVGHVTSDLQMDLVVATSSGGRLLSLPSAGPINAEASGQLLAPNSPISESAVLPLGDFDNDGYYDVAVVGKEVNATVLYVYYSSTLRNSTGLPQVRPDAEVVLTGNSGVNSLRDATVSDLNDDGIDDLVIMLGVDLVVLFGSGR